MTKAIAKSRGTSTKSNQDGFLGLSMVRLLGFRICRVVKKEASNTPLDARKTLSELFSFRNIK